MANFDQRAVIDTPQYSRLNMTFESIGTLQMGLATPVFHKSVIPGDSWPLSIDQIMRLAPLSSPVFDDVSLHFRAFFVPNRILDPRWKEFITAGVGLYGSNDAELAPLSFTLRSCVDVPEESRRKWVVDDNNVGSVVSQDTWCAGKGGLLDWLNFHFSAYDTDGHPAYRDGDQLRRLKYDNSSNAKYSFLPILGYHKIFDDWYRNERLEPEHLPPILEYLNEQSPDERVFDPVSQVISQPAFSLWRVNYGKDRYTTALPEPVVGGDIPAIQGNANLYSTGELGSYSTDSLLSSGKLYNNGNIGNRVTVINNSGGSSSLFVNLASAAENTIRQLKTAFKMYSFFMKDTYNGNRYVEFMDSHFDVRVPDATLDRAIYLGDHKVRVSFGEVFQTSSGDGTTDSGVLGDYAGRGAAYSDNGFLFEEKFLEHGQLYVIASIVPRAKYFQGIDRKFIINDRFDFFFPEFQDIGDDALFTKELFNVGTSSDLEGTIFGYSPRWSHLKESLDEVHGDFLTDDMDEYHFGRIFEDTPLLSKSFIKVPTINRPFAYVNEFSENYLINMRWSTHPARPVKLYESF